MPNFVPLPKTPTFHDITGRKFNRLYCLGYAGYHLTLKGVKHHRFYFRCDCGKEIEANGSNVKHGKHKSCGCLNSESRIKVNSKDLVGKKFGRLLVLERNPNGNLGRTQYRCLCSCGNMIITKGESLSSGDTSSCGCLRLESIKKRKIINLTGKQIGFLLVKEIDVINTKKVSYICLCKCGKEKSVRSSSLTSLKVRSCGCLRRNRLIYNAEYTEDDILKIFINAIRGSVKEGMKRVKNKKVPKLLKF